jgi:hypothetical protein
LRARPSRPATLALLLPPLLHHHLLLLQPEGGPPIEAAIKPSSGILSDPKPTVSSFCTKQGTLASLTRPCPVDQRAKSTTSETRKLLHKFMKCGTKPDPKMRLCGGWLCHTLSVTEIAGNQLHGDRQARQHDKERRPHPVRLRRWLIRRFLAARNRLICRFFFRVYLESPSLSVPQRKHQQVWHWEVESHCFSPSLSS